MDISVKTNEPDKVKINLTQGGSLDGTIDYIQSQYLNVGQKVEFKFEAGNLKEYKEWFNNDNNDGKGYTICDLVKEYPKIFELLRKNGGNFLEECPWENKEVVTFNFNNVTFAPEDFPCEIRKHMSDFLDINIDWDNGDGQMYTSLLKISILAEIEPL